MAIQQQAYLSNPSLLDSIPEGAVEHGEVFTRRWVVELILDLVDYRPDRDLAELRLVEPACGTGAFLGVIAERVGASCRKHGKPLSDAFNAVQAFDLLGRNVRASRQLVMEVLTEEGWAEHEARRLAAAWVKQGDYLLQGGENAPVDLVVGNPPYIRLEDVPDQRMDLYRRTCPTMTGRADIYVGFYETALASLKPDGNLAFICADRWMHNQYGRNLRRFISEDFAVDVVIRMHDVDAFQEQVAAYPAVTVLRRGGQGVATVVETTKGFGPQSTAELLLAAPNLDRWATLGFRKAQLPHWFPGDDLWPTGSPARLAALEELADRFTSLGDPNSGVRVGIGIATGADKVFITKDADLVEPERLLQLAMVRDTTSGVLEWSGHYLVNPWDTAGELIDLPRYPRLAAYFETNATALRGRHVAKRQTTRWFRTIDKVDPGLTERAKLLFPDMKLTSHPVLDPGGCYPQHNLYYMVSDTWDLRVLGGLLLSKVAEAFIEAYAVKMRGQTLRFQAQYLRRICVPDPTAITERDREDLIRAFEQRDVAAATEAALRVYGLDSWPA